MMIRPGVTGAMLGNHPQPAPVGQLPVRHGEYSGEM